MKCACMLQPSGLQKALLILNVVVNFGLSSSPQLMCSFPLDKPENRELKGFTLKLLHGPAMSLLEKCLDE